jgi:hypothetical protein
MMLMSRIPKQDIAFWLALFYLLPLACSRPADNPTDSHRVPFNEGSGARPQDAPSEAGGRSDANLPFGDAQNLPTGTLVTVRLTDPIVAGTAEFSGFFHAVVDESVLVDGNALLPRGSSAVGRVESARASELKRNRSYVRLKLESVSINGHEIPIHTSSLFVHGDAAVAAASEGSASSAVVRLETGRRLTFRLTEPLPVANSAQANTH